MPKNFNKNQESAFFTSRQRQIAESFSDWERIGRGWQIFDHEIELEPRFQRFISLQTDTRFIDDGRIPAHFRNVFSTLTSVNRLPGDDQKATWCSAEPQKRPAVETVSFQVYLPNELKFSPLHTEQLLLAVARAASFVSFEILAVKNEIILQITCPLAQEEILLSNLKSFLPGAEFRRTRDAIKEHFQLSSANNTVIVDFGLGREWFLPLPSSKNFAADSLLPLIASFEVIRESETACLQVLFSPARQNWQRAIEEAIFDQYGKLLFVNFQNSLPAIREKLSKPLFAAQIRLIVQSGSIGDSISIARRTAPFFKQFSLPGGNELIPLQSRSLDSSKHLQSALQRTAYRSGMLLTAQELSAIAHFPDDSVKSRKLGRDKDLTKPAPDFTITGSLALGENYHAGKLQIVKLSASERLKHMHVIGATGSGKSTFLLNLIKQDLEQVFENRNGLALIEPHGDLIDRVIEQVPESRLQDVILFDPADENFPIGFNILSAHTELEKTLLASDLVSIFRRFSTSWGDVMNSVLANAILAFLESKQGGNLLDLKRFLIVKTFREDFLKTVSDEELCYFWRNEFPQIKGKPFAPLLTRLDTFLRSKIVRNIVAQKENRLNFRRIMDERKILLVRLSLGAIGEENAYLLGSLIVAKIYQAALSRQNVAEETRAPFYLYLDEAGSFQSSKSNMNQILTGGRKFGLGLVLSHQQLNQFQSAGEGDILSSILSNSYARVIFRLDDTDAERLAKGFSFFNAEHLKNLGVGEAVARIEQSRYDFNLKTLPLPPVENKTTEFRRKAIIEQSRKHYAKAKAEVETENKNYRSPLMVSSSNEIRNEREPEDLRAKFISENVQAIKPEQQRDSKLISSDNSVQSNNGRGGAHHKQLQQTIKRMAETYGFQVEIEKTVLGGAGSIDVTLEKETLKIGCEVSVTSTSDYETKNALKCLAAGYHYAVIVVSNQKKLPALNERLGQEIPAEKLNKVKAFGLTGMLAFLRELTAPKATDQQKAAKPAGQRLSFAEACLLLNIAPSTLYRWIGEGRVPFYRPGREYQFDRDELILIGKQDLSDKRKASVKLEPLKIEKKVPRSKREQDARYRNLLKLD